MPLLPSIGASPDFPLTLKHWSECAYRKSWKLYYYLQQTQPLRLLSGTVYDRKKVMRIL